jgi:hypothetical protein
VPVRHLCDPTRGRKSRRRDHARDGIQVGE